MSSACLRGGTLWLSKAFHMHPVLTGALGGAGTFLTTFHPLPYERSQLLQRLDDGHTVAVVDEEVSEETLTILLERGVTVLLLIVRRAEEGERKDFFEWNSKESRAIRYLFLGYERILNTRKERVAWNPTEQESEPQD